MHQLVSVQFAKMLRNLDAWLGEALEVAEAKSFDIENLLVARLAPDHFHLRRNVQAACDTAKLAAARLTGNEPATHEDTDQTVAELRTRIGEVCTFLEGCTEADYEGAGEKVLSLPFLEGKVVSGRDYLIEFAQPNFYFHLTVAYAILRHNGVALGKRKYIGSMNLRDA